MNLQARHNGLQSKLIGLHSNYQKAAKEFANGDVSAGEDMASLRAQIDQIKGQILDLEIAIPIEQKERDEEAHALAVKRTLEEANKILKRRLAAAKTLVASINKAGEAYRELVEAWDAAAKLTVGMNKRDRDQFILSLGNTIDLNRKLKSIAETSGLAPIMKFNQTIQTTAFRSIDFCDMIDQLGNEAMEKLNNSLWTRNKEDEDEKQ